MEQGEIVRKTREMFENTGVIPQPEQIDPRVTIDDEYMQNNPTMPEDYELTEALRYFFTTSSSRLFQETMLTKNSDTYVCFLHFK